MGHDESGTLLVPLVLEREDLVKKVVPSPPTICSIIYGFALLNLQIHDPSFMSSYLLFLRSVT